MKKGRFKMNNSFEVNLNYKFKEENDLNSVELFNNIDKKDLKKKCNTS